MTKHSQETPSNSWALVLLATVLLWSTAAAESQSGDRTVDLRPRFVQGQTTQYHVWSLRQQTQSVTVARRSRDFDSRFEIEGQVTWSVDRVRGDGSARCLMTVQWLTAEYTGPDGQRLRSDSRTTRGKPEAIAGLLRAMAGVPVIIDVGPNGSVRSADGIGAIRRSAPKDAAVPDERDFIESASDLATLPGAGESVAINQPWNTQISVNHQLGTIHQSMRLAVVSLEEMAGVPIATVTGRAKLHFVPDPHQLPRVGSSDWHAAARMLDGHIDTQVLFDLQRHEAVGRNTLENRVIEITLRGPDRQTITRTIDEQIHSQVLRVAEQ